jgi:hypothetical protein
LELVDLAGLKDIGLGSLVVLFMLLLMFGRIRTKSNSDEIIELHKQRADDFKTALDKRDEQFGELLKAVETGNNLLQALTEAAERTNR